MINSAILAPSQMLNKANAVIKIAVVIVVLFKLLIFFEGAKHHIIGIIDRYYSMDVEVNIL